MTNKPILTIDFDGVLHSYPPGRYDPQIVSGGPTPGAAEALESYLTHFDAQIFSSRSHQPGGLNAMQDWCYRHFDESLVQQLGWPLNKPPAMLTLDDRALTFTGVWPTLAELKLFRPWNRRP